MGRIRSALRAYALLDLPPHEVLRLVDRKVDHFEIGTIATVVCAVMQPPYDTMTLALAGHPPPVIASPGGSAELVVVEPAPPLGMVWDVDHRSTDVTLPPGAVVAFYTDGLVERRHESLAVGLERLRAAVTAGPADTVARDIMRALLAGWVPQDDIALVVVRRTGEG